MQSRLLKQLLSAHFGRDDAAFRAAALKLASTEQQAGHSRVAASIREVLDTALPAERGPQQVVDIARPRKELAGLLEGGHRRERLHDIILTHDALVKIRRCLAETRRRTDLQSWGVEPDRKLLFYGPPGCGKTLAARVVAGELGLPLLTVRFDALFSRFLGETASHLGTIFAEMASRPGVYFFDEFDAIGKTRGDSQDVGEMRRVVVSFLQLMDADVSPSIIIAATNFEGALDKAVFRRFDMLVEYPYPNRDEVGRLIHLRLAAFDMPEAQIELAADGAVGLSFADIARACDEAVKSMVLDNRSDPDSQDLTDAILRIGTERGVTS